jgi:hypothetical protein
VLLYLFHFLGEVLGTRRLPVSDSADARQGLDRFPHGDPCRGRHRDRELVALRLCPGAVFSLHVALGCLPRVGEHGQPQPLFPVEVWVLLLVSGKAHFRFQFRAGFGDVCAKTREAAQGLIASDGQFVLLLHRDFGGIEDVSKVGVKVLVDVGDHVSTARHPC